MLTATVVVPTYRRRDTIADVLTPLLEDPATTQLVVVVDGSEDGSIELLRELASREPRLLPLWQENGGDQAARHTGLLAATGDVVVMVDDDVVAGPGLVTGHVRRHAEGEHRLVLGYMPTQLPEPRRPGQVATVIYADDYERTCALYEQDAGRVLTALWGGNWSLRRQDALSVGLLTEGVLGYHADMQFGLRCKRAGIVPVFDRTLAATHHHRRSLQAFVGECRRQGRAQTFLDRTYADVFDGTATSGSSRADRAFAALGGSPAQPAVSRALLLLTTAAGRLHLWPLETFLARVLRQVEINAGAQDGRRDPALTS